MYIELRDVSKSYGDFQASRHVSLGVERGALAALLGPSGSGKTTILRMIAGLERQDSGDVIIDGLNVNHLSVRERGVGFVFQSYALFPYLNVRDNVAYGLSCRGWDRARARQRVAELLDLVGLPGLEGRYPGQLSGGQRQRVAFARALATDPQVLLLDEPFAAIDAKIRKELRRWLRDTIHRIGITSIFVTHDQEEAMEVADELIVTNEGRVEQAGSPAEVYSDPRTPFVARFIGDSSVVEGYGRLRGFPQGAEGGTAIVRPEFVQVARSDEQVRYPSLYSSATVTDTQFRGDHYDVEVETEGVTLNARRSFAEGPVEVGEPVKVLVHRLYAVEGRSVRKLENEGFARREALYVI
ncbi:MAG: ABC transporter ATP-binding protein [Coriobacteriales bacterium]|jgi:sulfate transport system ATP-binding protein